MKRMLSMLLALAIAVTQIPVSDAQASVVVSSDFQTDGTKLLKYTGTAQTVSVPDGIKEIGEEAFSGNDDLIQVDLGDQVEKQDNMISDMKNAKANIYSYPLVTSDVFKTLEDCCPDKVLITITGYNCATGELQFDAVAPEVTDVSEVIEIWKTLDIFQGVYFTGYTQNQAQDGYTVKVVCILSEHAGRQAADEN